MKLFRPQIQLAKLTDVAGPDIYYLHVITLTDFTNYVPSGHVVGTMDLDGTLPITVSAVIDESVPALRYITPIVHTIELGPLEFPLEGGLIEVTFDDGSRGTTNGKKNVARSVDADEDAKPFG